MDELIRHFKNLEEDETLKQIDDAYNRGWNYAMNNPEVKKALERMKPKKVENVKFDEFSIYTCPDCFSGVSSGKILKRNFFCGNCGQALDWSE